MGKRTSKRAVFNQRSAYTRTSRADKSDRIEYNDHNHQFENDLEDSKFSLIQIQNKLIHITFRSLPLLWGPQFCRNVLHLK